MSELMPLPSTINIRISTPAADRKITLYAVVARKSTTGKVPDFLQVMKNIASALLRGALV